MRKDPYAKERAELRQKTKGLSDPMQKFYSLLLENAKGEKGDTPVKGKDYFTPSERKEMIAEILEKIPVPKDADPIDYDLVLTYIAQEVEAKVKKEVAKIPKPKDGTPGKDAIVDIPAIVASLLKVMPKMESTEVDYLGVKEYIDREVEKIKKMRPQVVKSFTGGGATSLSQLVDVDLSGLTKNASGQYILGGGGDSLPDQTGNNGKFLTTNGTDPSWATLAGGGDMAAATYDPQAIGGDAFDTDNHTDGTTNKVYTATEKTKLAGVETAADVTDAGNVGSSIHGATAKTTPVDADTMPLIDSAAANVLKKVTWANIKATIKAYTDTLYAAISHTHTASQVTDFDTEVANNSAVTANTAKLTADTTNVTAAGALMDSEVTNLPAVKAFDPTDYATAAQGATADAAPAISSGAGAPASTPTKVGDIYIDTTGDDAYIAVGTASSTDWEKSNDGAGGGTGDVVGPASATDNAIARFDSTTGKLLQDSVLTIADSSGEVFITNTVVGGLLKIQDDDGSDFFTLGGDEILFNAPTITVGPQNGNAYISVNDSTDGSITIDTVGSGDINLDHGSGAVQIGSGSAAGTVQSRGNHDLTIQTGNATTGSITITDGADGAINIAPNGSGEAQVNGERIIDESDTDYVKLAAVTATAAELNHTDGVTSNIQTQLDGKAAISTSINAQTGTTYTLVLADANKNVTMSNAAANTLTVPPNSSVAFPVGTKVLVTQSGAGATTIAAGAGVTINAPTTVTLAIDEQHESRGCIKVATDTWTLI